MVVYHREEELSPIEVAIDAITSKVADLQSVVEQAVPDLKKLQLRLQGSVSVQVMFEILCFFLNSVVVKFVLSIVEMHHSAVHIGS